MSLILVVVFCHSKKKHTNATPLLELNLSHWWCCQYQFSVQQPRRILPQRGIAFLYRDEVWVEMAHLLLVEANRLPTQRVD